MDFFIAASYLSAIQWDGGGGDDDDGYHCDGRGDGGDGRGADEF